MEHKKARHLNPRIGGVKSIYSHTTTSAFCHAVCILKFRRNSRTYPAMYVKLIRARVSDCAFKQDIDDKNLHISAHKNTLENAFVSCHDFTRRYGNL